MPLAAGTRLGPYEVLGPIGAGGMGEVYKARDTRLDRTVAIKVLPAEISGDPDRRARFEREARTIASLNHPHICTLHDVGEHGDSTYLVMEHLAGETLAERLQRGRLPPEQALTVATEIADALAAAHRQGIVHRDLKPGNVMLTKAGAKLLDFGLAKLAGHGAEPAAAHLASAVTRSAPLTAEGTIVGTLQYMAPEQLAGNEADARTDLWALGAILYEMLAGRPAFEGATSVSLMGAILERDPAPVSSMQPLTPAGLERIVRKCLAKQPEARWQTATDVADELRWVASGSGTIAPQALRIRWIGGNNRRWLVAAGALLVAGSVGVMGWVWTHRRQPPIVPAEIAHRQVTFSGDVVAASISPDGRTVAYAVFLPTPEFRLRVRDLAGGQALELWKGSKFRTLTWTPSGAQVLFSGAVTDAWAVWLAPRFGGEPRLLGGFSAGALTISPDGASLAGAASLEPGFRVVSVSGGEVRTVALAGVVSVGSLRWSSGTDRLAMTTNDADGLSAVWTAAPDGHAARRIYASKSESLSICWSPVPGELYLQRFRNGATDLVRLLDADDRPAAPEVLLSGLPEIRSCDVSQDGQRLVQVRHFRYTNLWRVDLHQPGSPPVALTQGTSDLVTPHLSRDGKSIAVTRMSGSQGEVVKIPIGGGEPSPLTEGINGSWSPDGRQLAFASDRGGRTRVWVSDADGRNAREIGDAELYQPRVAWLPDGRLAWQTTDVRNYRIHDLATGREEYLIADPSVGWVFDPQFSPKGDQVAVAWNRKKEGPGLWVLSWPGRVPRLVSPVYRTPVGWSADGRWIYAYGSRDLVRVDAHTGSVRPVAHFSAGGVDGCDLASDERTVVCALAEEKSDAWLVDHFDPRVPSAKR